MLSACPEFCKNSLISSVELILSRSCDVAMKKKLHRASAVVLSLALLASAFTIAPNADAAPKTKKITLSAKKKTLTAGSKFKLKVKKGNLENKQKDRCHRKQDRRCNRKKSWYCQDHRDV